MEVQFKKVDEVVEEKKMTVEYGILTNLLNPVQSPIPQRTYPGTKKESEGVQYSSVFG